LHESWAVNSWRHQQRTVSMWRGLSTTSCVSYGVRNNKSSGRTDEERTHRNGKAADSHELIDIMGETRGREEGGRRTPNLLALSYEGATASSLRAGRVNDRLDSFRVASRLPNVRRQHQGGFSPGIQFLSPPQLLVMIQKWRDASHQRWHYSPYRDGVCIQ